MAMGDRIKPTAQDVTGKVKQAANTTTDHQDLHAQGAADQASAATKNAGDDVADAAKDVFHQ